jgi:hypothetical protein
VSTVRLALDKVIYEIDLSAVNEARHRDKLAKFVAAGTEVRAKPVAGRGRKSAAAITTRPDKEQTQAIGQWAGPTGIRSLTVGVSRRQSRKRSAPLTNFALSV